MTSPASPLTMTLQEVSSAERLIVTALEEDLGDGVDVTSEALIPASATGTVHIVSRQSGVLAGAQVARMVFEKIDPSVTWEQFANDGDSLQPGSKIAAVSGPIRSLLTGERTALNFLTLLSGTATLTRKFVDEVIGTSAVILDTRKTLPGLRDLQKFAVRCGSGQNHRRGLYDAVLIKDNHIAGWQQDHSASLAEVVTTAKQAAAAGMIIEIEVDSIDQLKEVLPSTPDIVLLDNMSTAQLSVAVALRDELDPEVLLEASGGVNLSTVKEIAQTGVDRISVGGLTHSAPALDLGFDWL